MRRHGLEVVHSVYVRVESVHAVRIAVHHALEHDADLIVVPELTARQVRESRPWWAVTGLVGLVTATGVVECKPFE